MHSLILTTTSLLAQWHFIFGTLGSELRFKAAQGNIPHFTVAKKKLHSFFTAQ